MERPAIGVVEIGKSVRYLGGVGVVEQYGNISVADVTWNAERFEIGI
jgi:hypothetical protein